MKKINKSEFLYVERYRPICVDDLIIPEDTRKKIKSWIEVDKEIPNIMLISTNPGLGKTSLSKAISNDLDADMMFINASKDNGIDIIRNKITSFASAVSFDGRAKLITLDEADGLSSSAQESFRGFIEEYSQNARFILSANYQNKIIEPILNRLIIFDFDEMFAKNTKELAKQCFDRLCFILDNEQVQYKKEDVKPIVMSLYPSVRKMINTLQQSIVNGELIIDNTMLEANSIYDEIMMNVKAQQFDKCRSLIGKLHNPHAFYNYVYKNVDRLFQTDSIPTVIMITYHFLSSNVNARDPEISLAAYCAQIMRNVEIKFL